MGTMATLMMTIKKHRGNPPGSLKANWTLVGSQECLATRIRKYLIWTAKCSTWSLDEEKFMHLNWALGTGSIAWDTGSWIPPVIWHCIRLKCIRALFYIGVLHSVA